MSARFEARSMPRNHAGPNATAGTSGRGRGVSCMDEQYHDAHHATPLWDFSLGSPQSAIQAGANGSFFTFPLAGMRAQAVSSGSRSANTKTRGGPGAGLAAAPYSSASALPAEGDGARTAQDRCMVTTTYPRPRNDGLEPNDGELSLPRPASRSQRASARSQRCERWRAVARRSGCRPACLRSLAPARLRQARRIFTLPARHCELNGPKRVSLSPLSRAGVAARDFGGVPSAFGRRRKRSFMRQGYFSRIRGRAYISGADNSDILIMTQLGCRQERNL